MGAQCCGMTAAAKHKSVSEVAREEQNIGVTSIQSCSFKKGKELSRLISRGI